MSKIIIPERPDLKVVSFRSLSIQIDGISASTNAPATSPQSISFDRRFYITDFDALLTRQNAHALGYAGTPLPNYGSAEAVPAGADQLSNVSLCESHVYFKIGPKGADSYTPVPIPVDFWRTRPGRPSPLRGMIFEERGELNFTAQIQNQGAAFVGSLVRALLTVHGYIIEK